MSRCGGCVFVAQVGGWGFEEEGGAAWLEVIHLYYIEDNGR